MAQMDDFVSTSAFGRDLMRFVMSRYGIPWEPTQGIGCLQAPDLKSQFIDDVGCSVFSIIVYKNKIISDIYWELQAKEALTSDQFGYYAVNAVPKYFKDGYSAESFLAYCAAVCGVAAKCFQFPDNNIPTTAAEVVGLTLNGYMLTNEFYSNGGWQRLHLVSKQLAKALLEK